VRKITLLEGELVEEHRAWETTERENQECFEELTLLQTQGSKLCHAIVGPPRAILLSVGMRLAALRHIEMAGELATFRVAVSFAVESVLKHSCGNTTCTKVVGELIAVF
jgi:hypothetical protein